MAAIPLSFIIDDSTCLVNLAHFCIPQFAEVFPDRYTQPWRELPREIPDTFVRTFGEWCGDRGMKGKYSIVPYPACVGWVDREMPGWSRKQLIESVELVSERDDAQLDIHPEMITHTWVIDTKTGRPYPERSIRFMENWDWSVGRSADELANYLGYALKILKNAGLQCEGITTPGGFGNRLAGGIARRRHSNRSATSSVPRSRTTSVMFSPTTAAWFPGSSTPRGSTATIPVASSRSSAVPETGSAAGTA